MPIDESAALIAERTAVLETLRALEPDEWDAMSLCAGWRVRDVASHMSVVPGPVALLTGLVRRRGSVARYFADFARSKGDRPVAEILAAFERFAATTTTPPGIKMTDQAVDAFVHHHDIAIPLGREVPTDDARLRWLADGMVSANRFIGSAQRVRGLRLIATDIDWHHGTGPEIHGPAAAIILAGCGRTALVEQLKGDGLDVLDARR